MSGEVSKRKKFGKGKGKKEELDGDTKHNGLSIISGKIIFVSTLEPVLFKSGCNEDLRRF